MVLSAAGVKAVVHLQQFRGITFEALTQGENASIKIHVKRTPQSARKVFLFIQLIVLFN
jgi:hypothetical protein